MRHVDPAWDRAPPKQSIPLTWAQAQGDLHDEILEIQLLRTLAEVSLMDIGMSFGNAIRECATCGYSK